MGLRLVGAILCDVARTGYVLVGVCGWMGGSVVPAGVCKAGFQGGRGVWKGEANKHHECWLAQASPSRYTPPQSLPTV